MSYNLADFYIKIYCGSTHTLSWMTSNITSNILPQYFPQIGATMTKLRNEKIKKKYNMKVRTMKRSERNTICWSFKVGEIQRSHSKGGSSYIMHAGARGG